MSIQMLQPASATSRLRNSFARPAEGTGAAFAPAVTVLRTLDAVEAIADEWRALAAGTAEATGFQSYDWCRAWMAADDSGSERWRVLTVRDDGRLVGLWPLQRTNFLGARVLGWLGEPWTQYGDALVASGSRRIAILASAWREIAAWNDVDLVKLGRVRVDAALTALPGFQGRTAVHRENAPFVDLRASPSRRLDKGLRARLRKLEKIGPVEFAIVTDPEMREACVMEAIRRKRAWLGERRLASSGLWHPALTGLMTALAGTETLTIGRLSVGGETAALELGLQTPEGFRSLLGCHEPRFSMGSPGHLLIARMIDWCRDQGLPVYDLMVPADTYKRRWADGETVVIDHVVATRLRGRLAAAWFRARPTMKELYARLPERVRATFAVSPPG